MSLEMANSSADAIPLVVLDGVDMANAKVKSLEKKTLLNTRPVFRYKYQPQVRREEQQTPQPGRHVL